jgi:hypothetical protein
MDDMKNSFMTPTGIHIFYVMHIHSFILCCGQKFLCTKTLFLHFTYSHIKKNLSVMEKVLAIKKGCLQNRKLSEDMEN